jgi:hypothetical protein
MAFVSQRSGLVSDQRNIGTMITAQIIGMNLNFSNLNTSRLEMTPRPVSRSDQPQITTSHLQAMARGDG